MVETSLILWEYLVVGMDQQSELVESDAFLPPEEVFGWCTERHTKVFFSVPRPAPEISFP